MTDFSGKWVFDHAENMEGFKEKLNVDPAKIPKDKSTTVEITQNGDDFRIVTCGAGKQRDISFTIGKTFVDPDFLEMRNVEVKITPSWSGGKLLMTAGKPTNFTSREIVNNQMVVTFNWDGLVGRRFFNKA